MATERRRRNPAPIVLEVHAVLALSAAALVWDRHRPWSWVGIALVAIVLLFLLNGSRLAWWIQLAAIAIALGSVYEVHQRASAGAVDLSPFVDARLLVLLTLLLVPAGALLLLPSARRHVEGDRALSPSAVAFWVWLVVSLPAAGLTVEHRLPSDGVLADAAGGTLIGRDPASGVAFYLTERRHEVCVIAVATHAGGTTCDRRPNLERRAASRPYACWPWFLSRPGDELWIPPDVEERLCEAVRKVESAA